MNQSVMANTDLEQIYEELDQSVADHFPEIYPQIEAIMIDVPRAFSLSEDLFAKWATLTEMHQIYVARKWPNVVAWLRDVSNMKLYVLLTSTEMLQIYVARK